MGHKMHGLFIKNVAPGDGNNAKDRELSDVFIWTANCQ
jgi:hypothetical protein